MHHLPARPSSWLKRFSLAAGLALLAAAVPAAAEEPNTTIQGRITFQDTGDPVPGAYVMVVGTGRSARTDEDGRYEIRRVAPGTYEVLAQREHLTTARQRVTVDGRPPAEVGLHAGASPPSASR
jgi:hypothetical protein